MNKKISRIKKVVSVFSFLLLNISVFFIICHIGISYTFGKVTLEQILFHLNIPSTSVDSDILKLLSLFGLLYITFLFIHAFVFRNIIYKSDNLNGITKNLIYNITCTSISLTIIFYIDAIYDIRKFYNTETSTFIKDNYNDRKVSFNEKRNLVLIFLESIESGYTNASVLGKNLIPELEELSRNNVSFSGYIQTRGSGWTQASLVNMLLGIPLMWPRGLFFNRRSQRSNINKFLPHAISLTSTLHENGYSTNIFLGSSTSFSDKDKLFLTHKIKNVYDKQYFNRMGYGSTKNKGTGWGYKDDFIYKKAFDEYKQLSSSNKPFFLMVETVDTHFPNGYVEQDQVEFGDIRDSIRQSSIMCSNFVKKLYEYNNLHNTTVVIVGDHLWMMNPLAKFTEKMENIKPREIYNVFINSAISNKQIQTKRCYAPFDMAPTILEAIGANLHKNRFGLGTSLFSKENTLLERYGAQYVNQELAKTSPFYFKLF